MTKTSQPPSRSKLWKIAICSLVIGLAWFSIYFSWPGRSDISFTDRYASLATLMASEAALRLPPDSQLVLVEHEAPEGNEHLQSGLASTFTKEIQKLKTLAVISTEQIAAPSATGQVPSAPGITWQDLKEIAGRHPEATALISFAGLPLGRRPKNLLQTSGSKLQLFCLTDIPIGVEEAVRNRWADLVISQRAYVVPQDGIQINPISEGISLHYAVVTPSDSNRNRDQP